MIVAGQLDDYDEEYYPLELDMRYNPYYKDCWAKVLVEMNREDKQAYRLEKG